MTTEVEANPSHYPDSNNLHCGSFLEYHTSELNRGEKESSTRRRRLSQSEIDEQALRHRLLLSHQEASSQDALGRIVSDKNEWGKFHRALRERRSLCSTHAAIQQCINTVVEEQAKQMEDKEDQEGSSPSNSSNSYEEDEQLRFIEIYRKAMELSTGSHVVEEGSWTV
ncbi:expressed unknown protein [Seminavis robusta]|uniref:Uncharacterized protein n=1 Tax=Seminavis robusta TaxID=568900 RepID=A0A9N8D9H2_9STRA|nr:expressed unknown protein [Seminavis robusta]|eukprot:Sro23_g016140.1 n/a (168) ;mRNA; f:163777-164280